MKYNLIGKNEDSIINIFTNRGVNPNTILNLDESVLHSPFLMKNMKEAIELVHKHIAETNKKIIVIFDPDADGLTSGSIMYMYLTDCYPELEDRLITMLPHGKFHGIPMKRVQEIEKVGLVIAPDCSSNEEDSHRILKEQGIDVVVLDHHDAERFSDYATMVNISLDDYPNKYLSGAMVTYKFCKGYDELYNFEFADNYIDLATWGCLADMIESKSEETIYLFQEGMKNIKTPFAQSMYKAKSYNIGDTVTPTGIVFYISPLLNAAIRVGTDEEREMLIKAMISKEFTEVPSTKRGAKEGDTEIIQEQAIRVLNNIKTRQGREVTKAMAALEKQIKDNDLTKNQVIMLDTEGKFPTEFNGLIANKFLQEYKKPILVGMEREVDGVLSYGGSGRGDDKSTLNDLRGFLNDSGLVTFSAGHSSAHGFGMPAANKEKLTQYFNEKLAGEVFEPIYQIDFIKEFKELNMDNMLDIIRYSTFWARGLEEPKFLLRNVPVFKGDIEITGNFDKQLIKFKSGPLQFVSFNRSTKDAIALKKNQKIELDVIGSISMNTYKGESNPQVIVDDFQIKASQQYYF